MPTIGHGRECGCGCPGSGRRFRNRCFRAINSDDCGHHVDWNAVEGQLQRYERATPRETWSQVGEPTSIVVGKNGLGWGIGVIATDDPEVRSASDPVKKEGDGKAPAGVFALGTAFGYASQPPRGLKMPYLSLTASIECVDDAGSKYYNRVVDHSAVVPDWNSSEHMRSTGELYRWGVVVGHNGIASEVNGNPSTPGGGSCIFLHIWRSPGTGHGRMHCHAASRIGNSAYLARSNAQAAAGTTANAGIWAADRSLEVAGINQCSSALRSCEISNVRDLQTSHSGLHTLSSPYSRTATTLWG